MIGKLQKPFLDEGVGLVRQLADNLDSLTAKFVVHRKSLLRKSRA